MAAFKTFEQNQAELSVRVAADGGRQRYPDLKATRTLQLQCSSRHGKPHQRRASRLSAVSAITRRYEPFRTFVARAVSRHAGAQSFAAQADARRRRSSNSDAQRAALFVVLVGGVLAIAAPIFRR
jgi:hypothetical protein